MKRKVIIVERNNKLLLFLLDEKDLPCMIQSTALSEEETLLGNIYIGRVAEVAEGLQAIFVNISSDQKVFLPLAECESPLLLNREYDGKLKQGDELVVQITSQAVKTKLPGATTNLTLIGQYCICNKDGHGFVYSKKLGKDTVVKLKKEKQEHKISGSKKFGFVIRTNAGEVEDFKPVFDEIERFSICMEEILNKFEYRTCFSCLYHAEPELISTLKDIPASEYDEIVTDSKEVFTLLQNHGFHELRFYEDSMLSLSQLYSIETHLAQALATKVWLPSGGYLVIEPTEAMVVIDVNSGKGSNRKGNNKRNIYLKTNLEAAKEIARQLRLRNYSGMIMVDFINMEEETDNRRLMESLGEYLKSDKIKTRLVDMTALGIVEITRKKVSKPLDISI